MAVVYALQRLAGDAVYAGITSGVDLDVLATIIISEAGDTISATATVVDPSAVSATIVIGEAGDTISASALVESAGEVVTAPAGARRYALRTQSATFPRMQ